MVAVVTVAGLGCGRDCGGTDTDAGVGGRPPFYALCLKVGRSGE